MSSNLDKYREDLHSLIQEGAGLLQDLWSERDKNGQKAGKKGGMKFRGHYQKWYSEGLELVRQILPNRLDDFRKLYTIDKRRQITYENYTISDYLLQLVVTLGGRPVFDTHQCAFMRFQEQVLIVKSALARFESSLFDVKQLLRADLFDCELESSRELLGNGFLRAAGAVSGVVLEKHLGLVCENHSIRIRKRKAVISDYNDALKAAGTLDVPDWRFIQRLGDLRNLCDHDKGREPTKEEVAELIDGVEKVRKSVF